MIMKIETKFNIGDRIWVVYEYNGEVHVYSDEIDGMGIERDNKVALYFKNSDAFDTYEEDVFEYNDMEDLTKKIKELDDKIRKEEKHENN